MKYFFAFLTLFTIRLVNATDLRPELPNYTIVSNELDKEIDKSQSKFTFRITANDLFNERSIRYSVDDDEFIGQLNENNEFAFITKPGKHSFMLLLNTGFYEIITDTITIEPQFNMVIRMNFKSSTKQIMVRKPVIYLYPETETAVQVTIDPVGELFFTYPRYNNGWDVIAKPDGSLDVEGQTIDYLFWEAKMDLNVKVNETQVVLSKWAAEDHIASVLDRFGLTDNEKADFLTYWIPEILQYEKENIQLQFMFNNDCSAFGDLNVSPAPDKIGRIYLLWSPTDEIASEENSLQNIPSMDRTGFTVIEWGGAEIQLDVSYALSE